MISVLVPSLNRPHRVEATVANIRDTAPDAEILYAVSDDASAVELTKLGITYLWDAGGDTRYVTRMNKLAKLATGEFIFFGSDDILFHEGWAEAAMAVFRPGVDVVVVNDCYNPEGTQAVVRREYLDRAVVDEPGNAFWSGYAHNYADTEMFHTARWRGVYARAMESVVEHLHPVRHGIGLPHDQTYADAKASVHVDAMSYRQRCHQWGE